MKICKDISIQKLQPKYIEIVELRNWIAHGNPNIGNVIDNSSVDSMLEILYSKPVELMKLILDISKS